METKIKATNFVFLAEFAILGEFQIQLYSVVQLNLTPEIEALYILFDFSIFCMSSLKQHMKYVLKGLISESGSA